MYTTDLTFQQLGQTVLACGRIRVMVSKYVKINKKNPVIYYGYET
jgi:hypothetical protein